MASQSYFGPHGIPLEAVDTPSLLRRYPDITDRELTTLIRKFKHLPLLDFGLLSADKKLGEKMDQFYADHRDDLNPTLSLGEWAVTTAIILGMFFAAYFALG